MSRRVGLGIDVGTSALKAVAIDESGRVVAESDHPYPLLTPNPGWSEQDPADWWQAAQAALAEVGGQLAGRFEPVALGLSGQMHGMVPLDRAGEVVRPALLWNDQRTGREVREIETRVPRAEMIERTGNPAITGFQLPKLLWLRNSEPDSFSRTRQVLFPKDFLGYKLTGEMYAEPTDASGSNAFNVHALAWDGDVLGALDLDTRLLPPIVPSRAVAGHLHDRLARDLGLPGGLPVVAGAGDNAAAAYALGLTSDEPKLGSVSLGTSGVVLAPRASSEPDPHGRVHLFCHADGGFFLLGVTLAAGGSLRWFRDAFAPGSSFDHLSAQASRAPAGSGGVTFKPYLAGERTPHLDPDLRGSFHGLSLASGLPELARAVLEGVAFSLRDVRSVLQELGAPSKAFLTGGGARSPFWAKMVADVLQTPLGISRDAPGAAHGAAKLALEAAGVTVPVGEPDGGWLEPEDFGPYAAAYDRYRELGP